MTDDWIGGKFFRDGMNMWRDTLPIAGSYTKGMGQLADMFGFTPSAMLREVVSTARRQLIGKPVEFDIGTDRVGLVLEDLGVDSTSMGPALGQLGDVELLAGDLRWNDIEVERVVARLRNVHVQPGTTPVLVAAPIEFEITLVEDAVRGLLRSSRVGQKVEVELGDDAAYVRPLRGRRLGHIDVALEPAPRHVNLIVTDLHAADRVRIRRGLGAVPRLRVDLPEALHNRVHAIDVENGKVVLRGHVAEWREPIGVAEVEQLVDRLGSFRGGVLEVPRAADAFEGVVDRARNAELSTVDPGPDAADPIDGDADDDTGR
ncbi:MAG: hypothetical protein QNM02_18120 [Acidimicrobiia bacterium]|nr:hypothetical protein [Acidimicrobiia bacterium]